MIVLIYGGGAVGLGLAGCLLKAGAEVDIVAREDTVATLRKQGLVRDGIFGDYYAGPSTFGCYTSLDAAPAKDCDFILVCTKSFDSDEAAKDLYAHKSSWGAKAKIVLCQNGWGNAEKFASFFDKQCIYSARVITGFHRPQKNRVTVTVHADAVHIGSLYGSGLSRLENLCRLISLGGIPCETTGHIGKDLWAKMLYNCALNPLGAILDVPYGVLAQYDFSRNIMNGITEEVFQTMAAAGYCTHWKSAQDFLQTFYDKLVPDTAQHKSSTLQDLRAGKSTEIDALNGAVIKLALRHNVEVPYNLVVYNIIKCIEAAGSLSSAGKLTAEQPPTKTSG